jgi:hypothetical protein
MSQYNKTCYINDRERHRERLKGTTHPLTGLMIRTWRKRSRASRNRWLAGMLVARAVVVAALIKPL